MNIGKIRFLVAIITTLVIFSCSSKPITLSFFDNSVDFKTISFKEVEKMIKKGANVNEREESTTFTVLMKAAYHTNDPRIIELLVIKGARVNDLTKDDCTALMWAAYVNENEQIVYSLIKAGSNVNSINRYGVTPLMLASYGNSNIEVIKTLITNGADINTKDYFYERDALIWAACNNKNHKIIEYLINNGANVNSIDRFLSTPLIRSSRYNQNSEVIRTLLDKGANLNYSIPYCSHNYFDVHIDMIFPEWIENIVKDNSHLEEYNVSGMNALMFAACDNENSNIINLLIERGCNVNLTDDQGTTALMFAAWNNNSDVLLSLLNKDANTNKTNRQGMTALDFIDYDNNVKIRSSDAYFKLKQATTKIKKN